MARIFCALPIYKAIHPACKKSLERLEAETSHQFAIRMAVGEPIIDVARQYLFGRFLQLHRQFKFDYFWQLDSDIWFDPSAIDRIVSLDLDCVSGMYAFKGGPHKGMPVTNFVKGAEPDERGLIRCTRLPGGFLFIKPKVLLNMCKANPGMRYMIPASYDLDDPTPCHSFAFWSGIIRPHPDEPGEKVYFPEDFAFSTRIRESGVKLYADITIQLRHCFGQDFVELPFA